MTICAHQKALVYAIGIQLAAHFNLTLLLNIKGNPALIIFHHHLFKMIQNERFAISKNGLFLADDGYFVANPCKAILFIEIAKAAKQFALMRNSLQPDWQNDSWHIVPVLIPFPSA